MTNNQKTAALLVGFGGPTRASEIRPFIQSVLEGAPIPPQRFEEVVRHYEAIGGVSPFNSITYRQKEALERYLGSQKEDLNVAAAFRHSTPDFQDAFEAFKRHGIQKVVGFVLASFRSSTSLQRYRQKVLQGRRSAGAENIEIDFTDAFDHEPFYREAQRARVEETWGAWSAQEKSSTYVIYTAHSIPMLMCENSCRENDDRCYGAQFYETAREISSKLGLGKNWTYAYQSRSGDPNDLWTEPDVKDVLRRLDPKKFSRVLLVPVGFLCDNVEVLYDLDVEAKEAAKNAGFGYLRASTVTDHPKFIEMIGSQVLRKIETQIS